MSDHTIVIIRVVKIFFVQFSVYSCHLFLISSASVRSIPFLSFIEPIFAWNVSLVSLIFLKGSLVFPILLFSSISLHWLLRKAFLSLLAILWNSGEFYVILSTSQFFKISFLMILTSVYDTNTASLSHSLTLENLATSVTFSHSQHIKNVKYFNFLFK